MANVPKTRDELVAALHTLVPRVLPADAAARCLLLAAHRHGKRQAWVLKIATEKLGADPQAMGRFGALEHPPTQKGRVPGLPEWGFFFHGRGCCLTHDDGTCIDVDFVDGSSEWIDRWFFDGYLASLPAPEPVEARLVRVEALSGYWQADLPTLRDLV